ncbi:MAG TPA: hypothetical protein VFR21_08060, partial [Bradyrhizobium sp.]|nr:hypothetical protein [Bradyrhizobium sp.]
MAPLTTSRDEGRSIATKNNNKENIGRLIMMEILSGVTRLLVRHARIAFATAGFGVMLSASPCLAASCDALSKL